MISLPGAITFTAAVHCFCGHCRELLLLCACEGDPSAGRDSIYCNLPPPLPRLSQQQGKTKRQTETEVKSETDIQQQKHFLMRWASLVAVCKPLLSFDVHLFLRSEGEQLVHTLQTQGGRLTAMVELFIPSISSSEQLPMLINALGMDGGRKE